MIVMSLPGRICNEYVTANAVTGDSFALTLVIPASSRNNLSALSLARSDCNDAGRFLKTPSIWHPAGVRWRSSPPSLDVSAAAAVKIFSSFAGAIYVVSRAHTCGAGTGTCVSTRLRTSWHAGGQWNHRRTMLTGARTYAIATVSFRPRWPPRNPIHRWHNYGRPMSLAGPIIIDTTIMPLTDCCYCCCYCCNGCCRCRGLLSKSPSICRVVTGVFRPRLLLSFPSKQFVNPCLGSDFS